jgi:hypothetical protein
VTDLKLRAVLLGMAQRWFDLANNDTIRAIPIIRAVYYFY